MHTTYHHPIESLRLRLAILTLSSIFIHLKQAFVRNNNVYIKDVTTNNPPVAVSTDGTEQRGTGTFLTLLPIQNYSLTHLLYYNTLITPTLHYLHYTHYTPPTLTTTLLHYTTLYYTILHFAADTTPTLYTYTHPPTHSLLHNTHPLAHFTPPIHPDGTMIVNGIQSWVYEEEVFSSGNAIWWSPDSARLAYFRSDETNVPQFLMPIYGNVYPRIENLAYPKVIYI